MKARRAIVCVLCTLFALAFVAEAAHARGELAALENVVIASSRKAARAVVQMRVYRKKDEPQYREYPTPPMLQRGRPAPGYNQRPYGPCSGVCIDRDGHILTSYFNVSGEIERIIVTFGNGKRYAANLMGYSKDMDVAVLKIEGEVGRLPYLELYDSKDVRAGSFAMAVGRAQNVFEHSLSFGVISATGRLRPEIQAYQFDARVNYGVTGGALLDIEGNLIGIIGYVLPGESGRPNALGQSSGVGFANTSAKLLSILEDLKAGKVLTLPKRAFLGIKMEPTYDKNDGVLIKEVIQNTAAADAGIEPGDLIVEMDGKPVRNVTQLIEIMKKKKIGGKVKVKIKRGEEIMEIEVVLREPPPGM